MKLNRKGYLTVEIILASTIAFAIAFFLIEITVKLVSKTDDVYHETVIAYDDAIIINNIKKIRGKLIKDSSASIRVRGACLLSYFGFNFTVKILNKMNKHKYIWYVK